MKKKDNKNTLWAKIHRFGMKKYEYFNLRGKSADLVFDKIYKENKWGDPQSKSGPGSNIAQTRILREKLPLLFERFKITTILDIPCGDFMWMNSVDLSEMKYYGADIVEEIIEKNRKFEQANITFCQLDLIHDDLPKVDLVLVRDCFVHFSYKDVFRALNNIARSGSSFLLSTTFFNCKKNKDIITGQWRNLNLQVEPINLPPPIVLVKERPENDEWEDKSLGLWEIDDIKNNETIT